MATFKTTNPKFIWDETSLDTEHPNLELLQNFKYLEDQLRETPLPEVGAYLDSNVQVVDDRPTLIKLLQALRKQREIAVDVHDRKSKKPLELVGISTISTDYVLDIPKIKEDMGLLSEIFLNPQIVKIFGKAKSHLSMLRRNLCLYFINVVDLETVYFTIYNQRNVFHFLRDTFSVNRSEHGIVNYTTRPLSRATIHHCRASVHYFIYIYNDFKNQLLAKDKELWLETLESCRKICTLLSESDENHADRLNRTMNRLRLHHEIQLQFLRKLYKWRDSIASKENLAPENVVSSANLLKLTSLGNYSKATLRLKLVSGYIYRDFDKLCAMYHQIHEKVVTAKQASKKV